MSDMFCFQCQQTAGNKCCVSVGVCGKQPDTAALQDELEQVQRELAAQAEKLGYQDGDKYTQNDGVVYINGFDSPSALNTFIEDLHGCVNRSEAMAAHQREER